MFKKLPPSDALIIIVLLVLLSAQLMVAAYLVSDHFTTETPIQTGEIHEGTIGIPVHKNPLLATNTVEQDITALMHAGLLRRNSEGVLDALLAEHWKRNDSNTYTFRLKKHISFHDGTPITVNDVVFTLQSAEQLSARYPHLKMWKGVRVTSAGKDAVTITVSAENLSFPESFTLPIIPHHIWRKIPINQWRNYIGPGVYVGAGPYRHRSETLTLDGRLKTMTLEKFDAYSLGGPYIKKIVFHFFIATKDLIESYTNGNIDSVHSVTANDAIALLKQSDDKHTIHATETNKVFGVFFNTEDGRIMQDPFLRSVLSQPVDRDRIIHNVFHSRATAIQSPLSTDTDLTDQQITEEEITQTLEDIGWKFEGLNGRRERDGAVLRISFVFPDTEETRQIASVLTDGWQRLGVEVDAQPQSQKKITEIIAKKNFDVILYGYRADKPKDLVRIWKSGDEKNIASITSFGSPILNDLLRKIEIGDTRTDTDEDDKKTAAQKEAGDSPEEDIRGVEIPIDKFHEMVYLDIKAEMVRRVPAIFLYSPHFLYILPKNISGITTKNKFGRIGQPSDRFANVHKWHIRKEKVWNFLIKE